MNTVADLGHQKKNKAQPCRTFRVITTNLLNEWFSRASNGSMSNHFAAKT
jgi:hypothetical protein